MIIKVLSFPSGVLIAFDYKPRSSKFYIASKTSSFPLILFSPFQPWKVVSRITSQDLIYFSKPAGHFVACVFLYLQHYCWIHKLPQLRLSLSESQGWLPIIYHGSCILSGVKKWGIPHFGNLLTTQQSIICLKTQQDFCPLLLPKMCSSIFLTQLNTLWRLSISIAECSGDFMLCSLFYLLSCISCKPNICPCFRRPLSPLGLSKVVWLMIILTPLIKDNRPSGRFFGGGERTLHFSFKGCIRLPVSCNPECSEAV